MRRFRRPLILLLVILPTLACQAAARLIAGDKPATPAAATPSLATAAATEANACPLETGMILREANSESLPFGRFPTVDTSSDIDIAMVTYDIRGDQLLNPVLEDVPKNLAKYQKDFPTQKHAWELFTALIPGDQRTLLSQFVIMTDGPGGVLSAVEQTSEDPQSWVLELDIADIPDTKNLTFTLLHEFGHLLTLGPSQVPPDLRIFNDPHNTRLRNRALAACTNYFPGEGCSLPTSYVNVFFNRFWKDVYAEWSTINRTENDNRRDAQLLSFYRKYRDQFVDSYAASSPVEDIAETWAYYILSPRPTGNALMAQKLSFFYEYPKLVALRSAILSNLCAVEP